MFGVAGEHGVRDYAEADLAGDLGGVVPDELIDCQADNELGPTRTRACTWLEALAGATSDLEPRSKNPDAAKTIATDGTIQGKFSLKNFSAIVLSP